MTDKTMFWTVVKADAIFALISIVVSIALTIIIALWRKRRARKAMRTASTADAASPKAFLIGGRVPKPGECPLCGREWPLPGPVSSVPERKE
jgi:hypothetical protein